MPNIIEWTDAPQMSIGAPMPEIRKLAGSAIYLAYITDESDNKYLDYIEGKSESEYNEDVDEFAVVRFIAPIHHTYGYPNDEGLRQHPLYAFGLERYAFNVIEGSPTVAALSKKDASNFDGDTENGLRIQHWVVTFKDDTLEIVAESVTYLGTVSAKNGNEAIDHFVSAV